MNPVVAQANESVNAYVMQDEARHVAFGRLSLRDYYPQLTESERNEREEFLIDACWHMRDRFDNRELWEALDLPVQDCMDHMVQSGAMTEFRSFLFTRIVPIVKDIGLWSPKVRDAYTKMGVIGFADTDVEALQKNDEDIAKEFDARRKYVTDTIAAGKAAE